MLFTLMKTIVEKLAEKKTDRTMRVKLEKEKYFKNGQLRRRVKRETDYAQDPHCCDCEDDK